MVSIVNFEKQYAEDFKQLNLEWLDKFGLTEAPDLEMLNDPQQVIIDPGGFIFLAKSNEEIIGSAALIKEKPGEYELAKMVVSPAFRGKGISKLLIEQCLGKAKQLGAHRVFLVSNSQLATAISLYEHYGFRHIPVTNSHYVTADVMMELLM
ncbi:MAG: GNAT family N-acetyltransferase [Ferruginibacter sp.]